MEDALENYNNLIDKFEDMPEIKLTTIDREGLELSAVVSQAISLKRIADALDKPPTAMYVSKCEEEWEKLIVMLV